VERWFGELTGKPLRRGVFVSIQDLVDAIHYYMAVWNQNLNPFVWTAIVESIVEKLRGSRQILEQIKPGSTAARSKRQKTAKNNSAVSMPLKTQEKRGLARFVQRARPSRPCCRIVTGGTPVPLGHGPTR
jgi:hypothetical protein